MSLEIVTHQPSRASNAPPLLFLHGAWHGAWSWEKFLPYFAAAGYPSYALSYRGHGKSSPVRSLRFTSLSEYVDDVAEAASQLPSTPVLVAHSMGGFVAHHYLRKHEARGVALISAVPPRGAWHATWHVARRHPIAFALTNLKLSLHPIVATPALASDLLGDILPYYPLLQDESYLAYMGILFMPVRSNRRLPALVIGSTTDKITDVSDVRSTARFYGCDARIFEGLGHDMMLEPGWEEVAAAILQWLRETF